MPTQKEVEYIDLTLEEFKRQLNEYGEYSCSLPTGTTIGKKWFRNEDAYSPRAALSRAEEQMAGVFPDWWMGEYAELTPPNPDRVAIIWRKVRIVTTKKKE